MTPPYATRPTNLKSHNRVTSVDLPIDPYLRVNGNRCQILYLDSPLCNVIKLIHIINRIFFTSNYAISFCFDFPYIYLYNTCFATTILCCQMGLFLEYQWELRTRDELDPLTHNFLQLSLVWLIEFLRKFVWMCEFILSISILLLPTLRNKYLLKWFLLSCMYIYLFM